MGSFSMSNIMQKEIDITEKEIDKLTPKEFFDLLKIEKIKTEDEELKEMLSSSEKLMEKFITTKQEKSVKKLKFIVKSINKELKLKRMGIDTFIYQETLENYIENVSDDVIKIQELENYEREIPDEIVEIIKLVDGIFSNLYVVFTDYTGEAEAKVEEERRDKDPILFGVFRNEKDKVMINRFYFLGDWIDEYCDLTLEKMVNQLKEADTTKEQVHYVNTPITLEEIKEQMNTLDHKMRRIKTTTKKKVSKVKTFLNSFKKKRW